eukprot:8725738-Alexandrium_andersonii.AAC.1
MSPPVHVEAVRVGVLDVLQAVLEDALLQHERVHEGPEARAERCERERGPPSPTQQPMKHRHPRHGATQCR